MECHRALAPGGLVALFGYATPVIGITRQLKGHPVTDPPSSEVAVVNPDNDLNVRLTEFYDALDWPEDRVHIETRYERLLLDSSSGAGDLIGWRDEALTTLKYNWPVGNFISYLSTWSGYRRQIAKDESNVSLLSDLAANLKTAMSGADIVCVDFDVFAVYYRKKPSEPRK